MFSSHHSTTEHHHEKAPLRNSRSGSFMENMLTVTPHDIRSASNTQLRNLRELIDIELEHRSRAKAYFIVEKHNDYIVVEEAKSIEDEDVPRYIRLHERGETLKFHINEDSIFHQTPEFGQVFEIFCREGNTVDVARRVATHG